MNHQVVLWILGSLLCFGGWIVLWLGSRMIGATFGLGMGFCFGFVFAVALDLDPGPKALVELGCALMGAVGGVLLIRALNTFVLLLVGFLFGVLLGRLGVQIYAGVAQVSYKLTPNLALLIVLVGAASAGLALWLRRTLAIVITAFVGTSFLCASLGMLQRNLPWSFALLLALSLFIQSSLSRLMKPRNPLPQSE